MAYAIPGAVNPKHKHTIPMEIKFISEGIVIPNDTKIKELIKKLDSSTSYSIPNPEGSIMGYGQLCQCYDMCLCEHRLQWLIGWIKENYG